MKFNEQKIDEYLNKEYQYHINNHGSNHILGTFLVGTGNYGFAESLADLQFVTIYLPAFEELCTGEIEHNGTASAIGYLVDIRKIYTVSTQHQNTIALEILYSSKKIITPKYADIYNKNFHLNRDSLALYSPKERLYKAYTRAESAFKEGNLFEGVRLSIAARMYANGMDCDSCFHIKDPIYQNYLWSCKHKTIEVNTDEILAEMEMLYNAASDTIDPRADTILKTGIVELVSEGLKETVSIDVFETCLTQTEKKAWEALKNQIHHGAGLISISKITEDTGISRPVFKNLLLKMETNNIAKIENQGVKGTYIQMLI